MTAPRGRGPAPAGRAFAAGGAIAFAASLLVFAAQYARGFDRLPAGDGVLAPVLVNTGLFGAFALHHSLFARLGVKRWLASRLPSAVERSMYVWIASLLFAGLCLSWRPVPGDAWRVEGAAALILRAVQAAAVLLAVAAARRLDVGAFTGARLPGPGARTAEPVLDTGGLYRLVRHPLYLAWVGLVWAAPVMNGTRLTFAALGTLYLVAAIPFEERDLQNTFGARYAAYRARVRWRLIPGVF